MRIVHGSGNPPTRGLYSLLTASIVPRPIAWVSTVSRSGVRNLSPYSFFTVACTDPAIVSVTSIGHQDTYRNAVDTGEFVVNIGTEPLMEVMNVRSASYGHEVDVVMAEDGLPDMGSLLPPSRLGRDEWGLSPRTRRMDRPR